MASINNITLKDLSGVWVSTDNDQSMWISDDGREIVIIKGVEVIVREHTKFIYNSETNNCKLSDSVELSQLFDDDSILIHVVSTEDDYKLILKKRNY